MGFAGPVFVLVRAAFLLARRVLAVGMCSRGRCRTHRSFDTKATQGLENLALGSSVAVEFDMHDAGGCGGRPHDAVQKTQFLRNRERTALGSDPRDVPCQVAEPGRDLGSGGTRDVTDAGKRQLSASK